MVFAISSLATTVLGMAFVGTTAFGAGYGALIVLAVGTFLVSSVGAMLAAVSFARKESRQLSALALGLPLALVMLVAATLAGVFTSTGS